MNNNVMFLIELTISFLPFILFAFFNSKANIKKENRYRQYPMPVFAVIYSIVLLIFLDKLQKFLADIFLKIADFIDNFGLTFISDFIRDIYTSWGIYLELVLFNTAALLLYIIVKRMLTAILGKFKVNKNSFVGSVVELFYSYDELEDQWYIKNHYGQACTFIKTAYYGSCFVSGLTLLISCGLSMNNLISAPFYPVFAVIIIGEMAFFVDGITSDLRKSGFDMQADNSRHIAMYPLLRKPLKALFGDKLSTEGTTVNLGGATGGAIEDILIGFEQNGGHIGKNYAAFIRGKMELGLKPNVDYVTSGYDLATGKSLLFNTPFYDKLNPYVFYAMNRELLKGGKILIVLGRHGTEEDLYRWSETGMKSISNIPDLWRISVLSGKPLNEDEIPDIGIITRSGVHDLDIHKNNIPFLRKVSFVVVVEPSRLVTTAQIGLNLLIKCCGTDNPITFCSVDRNCDGLVDALSHILMTNLTEVSATEYPHGMSSYMYWTEDGNYLQHRILPGVSRYLGIGTELSMVALKNQVKKTVWYGGEAYPVLDVRWIAKQYYYDLMDYAQLPTNQENFDKVFTTSFNMCDERVSDYSFITVEDDRYNLFETRRNFATIAEQQGFVNVISSEYMLREYMSDNNELFIADAKAIPYITADYARTKRNSVISLCLLLCVDTVNEKTLNRHMIMQNIETDDPLTEIWKEICMIFGDETITDNQGNLILCVKTRDGKTVQFERDSTIIFKRNYSVESGKFESVYTIENADFSRIILEDLQNASYIAEQEDKDVYIGSELKGHVYQKYMPGQFFTLNGKYYEMVSTATDNRIMVRRASEHIGGRLAYRQIRNYTFHNIENSDTMGALKSVNNIDIHYQFADFSVSTSGYWKLNAYNDFDNGVLITINGVPTRNYHHKQILKFDFSKFGDSFTDTVRMTLTNLLNEVFVTLFADNQAFITAVTPGQYDAPLTYSLDSDDEVELTEKCIYIIEDSQLDIGLLIAVERNVNRILQIVTDYLLWNEEQIAESIRKENEPEPEKTPESFDVYDNSGEPEKKKGFFGGIVGWFKSKFKKKDKQPSDKNEDELTPKKRKKLEKAKKKAEKQAAKEQKRADKEAAKQQKKAEKEAKKNRKNKDDISEPDDTFIPPVIDDDSDNEAEKELIAPENKSPAENSDDDQAENDFSEVESSEEEFVSDDYSEDESYSEEFSEEAYSDEEYSQSSTSEGEYSEEEHSEEENVEEVYSDADESSFETLETEADEYFSDNEAVAENPTVEDNGHIISTEDNSEADLYEYDDASATPESDMGNINDLSDSDTENPSNTDVNGPEKIENEAEVNEDV